MWVRARRRPSDRSRWDGANESALNNLTRRGREVPAGSFIKYRLIVLRLLDARSGETLAITLMVQNANLVEHHASLPHPRAQALRQVPWWDPDTCTFAERVRPRERPSKKLCGRYRGACSQTTRNRKKGVFPASNSNSNARKCLMYHSAFSLLKPFFTARPSCRGRACRQDTL